MIKLIKLISNAKTLDKNNNNKMSLHHNKKMNLLDSNKNLQTFK